jgi:hypothetical protein
VQNQQLFLRLAALAGQLVWVSLKATLSAIHGGGLLRVTALNPNHIHGSDTGAVHGFVPDRLHRSCRRSPGAFRHLTHNHQPRRKIMKLIQRTQFGRCVLLSTMLLAMLVTSGCTSIENYYPVVNHPKLGLADLAPQTNKPTVELTFEFLSRGKPAPAVALKWQPHVIQFLDDTHLFAKVNPAGIPSDLSLHVQMNNVVSSMGMGGAVMQGIFSGLTFGLIGTKVTDNYDITARLEGKAGEPVQKAYHYGLTSTTGLIKGSVPKVEPYKNDEAAFQEVMDQFLWEWLKDLQKENRLQPPFKPAK